MTDLMIVDMQMCESMNTRAIRQVGAHVVTGLFSEAHAPHCSCMAFKYAKGALGSYKTCKHIQQAETDACGWHEQYSAEAQTEPGVCPRCGGKTITVRVGV